MTTTQELIDFIDKLKTYALRTEDGIGDVFGQELTEIQSRLLAAQEMAEALKHWKKEYQNADGKLSLDCGPLNKSEDIGDKALFKWEALK